MTPRVLVTWAFWGHAKLQLQDDIGESVVVTETTGSNGAHSRAGAGKSLTARPDLGVSWQEDVPVVADPREDVEIHSIRARDAAWAAWNPWTRLSLGYEYDRHPILNWRNGNEDILLLERCARLI